MNAMMFSPSRFRFFCRFATLLAAVAAGALWAAPSATWCGTKLNSLAVKDDGGNIVVLGMAGAYNNGANTKEKVFDGDVNTFFDPPSAGTAEDPSWAGLAFAEPVVVTRIRYYGRPSTLWNRMFGCFFQGANQADFSDAVTFHVAATTDGWTWDDKAKKGTWADFYVANPESLHGYKYLRLLGANGAYCGNPSEIEFYGVTAAALSAAFDGQTPTCSAANIISSFFINNHLTLGLAYTPAAPFYELQRKPAASDDSAYERVAYIPFCWDGYASDTVHGYLSFDEKPVYDFTTYRLRACGTTTQSPWYEVGTFKSYAMKGVTIGTTGSYKNVGNVNSYVFDGKVTTIFDPPSNGATGDWVGLDLGAEYQIAGIRAVARTVDADWVGRLNGMSVQVGEAVIPDPANRATCEFVNPVTVGTISGATRINTVEIMFPEPITTRYVRLKAKGGEWFNASEFEVVGTPHPKAAPVVTVTMADPESEYAVVTWTPLDESVIRTGTLVYRANGPEGPWTCLTTEPLSPTAMSYIDNTLLVGPRYYYAVAYRNTENGTDFDGVKSAPVRYRRGRRLDRNPTDETRLLSGFSVVCNAELWTAGKGFADLAFDGATGTCPDMKEAANQYIGLNMGGSYGLTAVRAYPRSNFTDRLNNAVAFGSNDTSNWAAGATPISEAIRCSSMAWCTAVGTSDAEYRYLLLGKNPYCNAAEIQFYGWSHADAQQIATAPINLTLTPTAGGTVVAWEEGGVGSTYDVRRQTNDGEWTTIASNLSACTYTDADAVYDGTRYSYRIVVHGANGVVIPSPVISSIPYVPGNGTGLYGVYYSNFAHAYNPDEAVCGERIDPQIDFNWGDKSGPYADVIDNFRVVWTGKIIIPFDGTYTFSINHDDGARLIIDDTIVVNKWDAAVPSATSTTDGNVALTAGEHAIRLDHNEGGGSARCILSWGGCVEPAVVPSTQLIPEKVVVDTVPAPWLGTRSLQAHSLGLTTFNPDGSITISHGGYDTWNDEEGFRYLWREIKGSFICTVKIDFSGANPESADTRGLLMVRNELAKGSPMMMALQYWRTGGSYDGKIRPGSSADNVAISNMCTTAKPLSSSVSRLRICRKDNTFSLAIQEGGEGTWIEIATWEDEDGVFNETLLIGPAVGSKGTNPLSAVTFSEFDLKPIRPPMVIIVR